MILLAYSFCKTNATVGNNYATPPYYYYVYGSYTFSLMLHETLYASE